MNSIELVSHALAKIGSHPITSFDDGSVEAAVATTAYPLAKRRVLSSFTWSFATREDSLNRLKDGGFAIPRDFLRAVKVDPRVEYKIMDGRLIAPTESIRLTYIADVAESLFPPMFASALTSVLAAEFAMMLLDDAGRYGLMERAALLELREARLADSAQASPKRIRNFALSDVRS